VIPSFIVMTSCDCLGSQDFRCSRYLWKGDYEKGKEYQHSHTSSLSKGIELIYDFQPHVVLCRLNDEMINASFSKKGHQSLNQQQKNSTQALREKT